MLVRGAVSRGSSPLPPFLLLWLLSTSGVRFLKKTLMLFLLALPFFLAFMIREAEIGLAVHVTNRNHLTVMVGVGITLIREESM